MKRWIAWGGTLIFAAEILDVRANGVFARLNFAL